MMNAQRIAKVSRPAATAPMVVFLVLLLFSLSGCGAVVAATIGKSDSRQAVEAAEAAEQYFNDVLGLQHMAERPAIYGYVEGALANAAHPIEEAVSQTPRTLRSLDFSGLNDAEKSQLVAIVFLDGTIATSTCSSFAATVPLRAVAVYGDTALVDTKLVDFHVTGNTTPVPRQGVLNRPIHLTKTASGWKVDARAQLDDLKWM